MAVLAENYQLKWHSFNNYLHSCVSSSLQNESFADVALVTFDGHKMMGHRFVLSANSLYFQQVLKYQPKVTTTLPIMIVLPSEISLKTLKILMQYMYSGEATVSNDILEQVLRGGDILKIKGLYRPKDEDKKARSSPKSTSNSTAPSPAPSPKPPEKDPQKDTTKVKNPPPLRLLQQKASEPKVNYSLNSKPDKIQNDRKSEAKQQEATSEDDTMQFLVIKEEPIEWTEVSEGDMELVDEKEVFNSEMAIKPEVFLDEEVSQDADEEMYQPLTCELCTETFTVPREWVRHVQTHTDMLPAKRQRRDRPSTEEELQTYPALHCDMCQKFFPTPAEWVHHIQNTHTEFELHLSNKQAPKSSSTSSTASSTTTMSTSTPERNESVKNLKQTSDVHKICPECNKAFPSHASMLIHKRTHTGERPYSCEFCFKGFNVKSNLLRHLRTLHNKIMNPTEVADSKEDPSD